MTPAHPRSRGEHSMPASASASVSGSSPLARGTLNDADLACCPVRLIPARAGNTAQATGGQPTASAHPRSRGEHRNLPHLLRDVGGSSPLARGTLGNNKGGGGAHRLIPARAGNTPELDVPGVSAQAHPRSRGEHSFLCAHP